MKLLILLPLLLTALAGCSSGTTTSMPSNENEGTTPSDNTGDDSNGMAANDFCPAGAIYDSSEDTCYIECDGLTDQQCDAREEEVFGQFDEFVVDNYGSSNDQENSNAIAKYSVQSDLSLTTLENSQPENDGTFQEIWNSANKILPRQQVLDAFSQYHVDTDGESNTLAYVTGDINQPGKWIIAFDNADYTSPNDREFIHTTIHEFGHVVFLSNTQLDTNAMGGCANYGISEGCSFENSYINRFFQQFWADIIEEHRAIDQNSESALMSFYEKYQNRFVSEYAATNPVEDAAEIFTNFVLRERPASNSTVVDQKILLMHDLPALVELRNQIRGKLSATRARARNNSK